MSCCHTFLFTHSRHSINASGTSCHHMCSPACLVLQLPVDSSCSDVSSCLEHS
jgi:hypothetical protein